MKYYFLSNDIWYINVEVIRPFKKNSFFIPLKNLGFFPVYRHCMICRYCLCRRLLESTSPASDCGNAFYHYRLGNNMTSKLPYSTKLDFCYLTLSYYIETSKLQNAKISGPNFEINISFKEAEYSSSTHAFAQRYICIVTSIFSLVHVMTFQFQLQVLREMSKITC